MGQDRWLRARYGKCFLLMGFEDLARSEPVCAHNRNSPDMLGPPRVRHEWVAVDMPRLSQYPTVCSLESLVVLANLQSPLRVRALYSPSQQQQGQDESQ
jgi:hypothetical protein